MDMGAKGTYHQMPRGTVGILAGLGPLAGAHFYRSLIERTDANNDSEHISVVLVSDNTIPSRVDNLLGNGPSPLPRLIELTKLLENCGASLIVITSSTTHAYYEGIQANTNVPVINLLEEISRTIEEHGFTHPALLATTPTVRLGLYRPYFSKNTELVYPDEKTQDEIQQLVFDIKRKPNLDELSNRLAELTSRNWLNGADCLVLACTELCLFDLPQIDLPIFSANHVLAAAIIRESNRI